MFGTLDASPTIYFGPIYCVALSALAGKVGLDDFARRWFLGILFLFVWDKIFVDDVLFVCICNIYI